MKKCPNCGKEVANDLLFCVSCGNSLQRSYTIDLSNLGIFPANEPSSARIQKTLSPITNAQDKKADTTVSPSEEHKKNDAPVTPEKANRKHPFVLICIILSCVFIALLVYDHFNPGFIQSIPPQVQKVMESIAKPSKVTQVPTTNYQSDRKGNGTKDHPDTSTVSRQESEKEQKKAEKQPVSNESGTTQEATVSLSESHATPYRVNNKSGLTIREKSNIKAKAVAKVKKDEIVYALDNKTVLSGSYNWLKVKTQQGDTGWIIADFLSPASSDEPTEEASEIALLDKVLEGTASYADISFTVKQTGPATGILTVVSNASDVWKFAPWVGLSSTVTLVRSDRSKSYAEINLSNMFSEYQTMNFDKGKEDIVFQMKQFYY